MVAAVRCPRLVPTWVHHHRWSLAFPQEDTLREALHQLLSEVPCPRLPGLRHLRLHRAVQHLSSLCLHLRRLPRRPPLPLLRSRAFWALQQGLPWGPHRLRLSPQPCHTRPAQRGARLQCTTRVLPWAPWARPAVQAVASCPPADLWALHHTNRQALACHLPLWPVVLFTRACL